LEIAKAQALHFVFTSAVPEHHNPEIENRNRPSRLAVRRIDTHSAQIF
jgi:hypothetical protein